MSPQRGRKAASSIGELQMFKARFFRALAHPVLRHRILTNFHAESEGRTTGELIDKLVETVPVPKSGM